MASSATTRNRLEKQGTGENTNTWGTKLNTSALDLIDASLDGRTTFTLSGSKTLTSTNYVADESRKRFLDITSGTGGTVTIPSVEKVYLVRNATSGSVVITTGSGATATIPTGGTQWVACDGTNCYLDRDEAVLILAKAYTDATAFEMAAGELPGQTGNSGKVLVTDGAAASWGYQARDWTLKTSAFTAALNEWYELDSSGGTIAVTLPAATNSGGEIRFRDKGSAGTNNVTLTRAGSDTIAGGTTLVINDTRQSVSLIDRSASWDVLL